jgi:hypothetical protein
MWGASAPRQRAVQADASGCGVAHAVPEGGDGLPAQNAASDASVTVPLMISGRRSPEFKILSSQTAPLWR